MSKEEAEKLDVEDVVAMIPNAKYQLHHKISCSLGLNQCKAQTLGKRNLADDGVIVGALDVEIWPESKNFSNTSMG